jgi:hypothetical protein
MVSASDVSRLSPAILPSPPAAGRIRCVFQFASGSSPEHQCARGPQGLPLHILASAFTVIVCLGILFTPLLPYHSFLIIPLLALPRDGPQPLLTAHEPPPVRYPDSLLRSGLRYGGGGGGVPRRRQRSPKHVFMSYTSLNLISCDPQDANTLTPKQCRT